MRVHCLSQISWVMIFSFVDEESDIDRTGGESSGIAEVVCALVLEEQRVDVVDTDSWKAEWQSRIGELSLETNEICQEMGENVGKKRARQCVERRTGRPSRRYWHFYRVVGEDERRRPKDLPSFAN